jgi:AcrR family transcriptional regulator
MTTTSSSSRADTGPPISVRDLPAGQRAADDEPVSLERRQREERILDAATALLVRFGYRKTTIDDVAAEAGVGKGTIYLHWKDKNQLFRAAIARASEQTTSDALARIAADPEGGRFHRVWTHGMLAVLANPLLSALMRGQSDIFQGLLNSYDSETIDLLYGKADEHLSRLQQAGLIRSDLPVSLLTYLMGALKIGVIHSAELAGPDRQPSMEQLAEGVSDLMRRWLEPEELHGDSNAGKRIMAQWLEENIAIERTHAH